MISTGVYSTVYILETYKGAPISTYHSPLHKILHADLKNCVSKLSQSARNPVCQMDKCGRTDP